MLIHVHRLAGMARKSVTHGLDLLILKILNWRQRCLPMVVFA